MAADKAEINILYEDAEIIVIDKPAGWVTTNEKSKTQILNSKNIENITTPLGIPEGGVIPS